MDGRDFYCMIVKTEYEKPLAERILADSFFLLPEFDRISDWLDLSIQSMPIPMQEKKQRFVKKLNELIFVTMKTAQTPEYKDVDAYRKRVMELLCKN